MGQCPSWESNIRWTIQWTAWLLWIKMFITVFTTARPYCEPCVSSPSLIYLCSIVISTTPQSSTWQLALMVTLILCTFCMFMDLNLGLTCHRSHKDTVRHSSSLWRRTSSRMRVVKRQTTPTTPSNWTVKTLCAQCISKQNERGLQ